MPKKKTKIIQVPMPEDLLEEMDTLAGRRGESRAAFIREACAEYVASLDKERAVAAYIQSYEDLPVTREEREWAKTAEILAAEVWRDEDWSREYAEFIKAEEELTRRAREKR